MSFYFPLCRVSLNDQMGAFLSPLLKCNFIGFPLICYAAFWPQWVVSSVGSGYTIVPNEVSEEPWAQTASWMMALSVASNTFLSILLFYIIFLMKIHGSGGYLKMYFVIISFLSIVSGCLPMISVFLTGQYLHGSKEDNRHSGDAMSIALMACPFYFMMAAFGYKFYKEILHKEVERERSGSQTTTISARETQPTTNETIPLIPE